MVDREFYLDPPPVRDIANKLESVGKFLTEVNKRLEECMADLDENSFIGKVGGAAVKRHLEAIQPRVEKAAKGCMELSAEVKATVEAHVQNAGFGATRFYR